MLYGQPCLNNKLFTIVIVITICNPRCIITVSFSVMYFNVNSTCWLLCL